MLHITNGDSVGNALVRSGLDGDIIVWRDVLHEGPVPAGLSLAELSRVRARFVHACGWTASLEGTLDGFEARDAALAESRQHDEVVLWFEHDLYDQLQLLQLLDWFAAHPNPRTRLSLVAREEYLGTLAPHLLVERFGTRAPVTAAQLELGQRAWSAFRAPSPTAITELLQGDLSALPFLRAALGRHLEQFPSMRNGLSRSEQQALAAIDGEPTSIAAAFLLCQELDEPAAFLGDATFLWYLARLGDGADPLLRFADGSPLTLGTIAEGGEGLWQREIILTPLGDAVLSSRIDRVHHQGIDRWLGGVHLQSLNAVWRWDQESSKLHLAGG